MTKERYLDHCLYDLISALDAGVPYPPDYAVELAPGCFFYPGVALERAKAIRDVDTNPYFNR